MYAMDCTVELKWGDSVARDWTDIMGADRKTVRQGDSNRLAKSISSCLICPSLMGTYQLSEYGEESKAHEHEDELHVDDLNLKLPEIPAT